MKAIITLVIGIVLFVSVGGGVTDSQALFSAPVQNHELASERAGITGTWYSFPVGMLVRFNGDGSADFGLDSDGTTVGASAEVWFEGTELLIRFTNYAGDNEACAAAVGSYNVQQLADGAIRFVPVQDECEARLNILSGQPDLGFDPVFQPVE